MEDNSFAAEHLLRDKLALSLFAMEFLQTEIDRLSRGGQKLEQNMFLKDVSDSSTCIFLTVGSDVHCQKFVDMHAGSKPALRHSPPWKRGDECAWCSVWGVNLWEQLHRRLAPGIKRVTNYVRTEMCRIFTTRQQISCVDASSR